MYYTERVLSLWVSSLELRASTLIRRHCNYAVTYHLYTLRSFLYSSKVHITLIYYYLIGNLIAYHKRLSLSHHIFRAYWGQGTNMTTKNTPGYRLLAGIAFHSRDTKRKNRHPITVHPYGCTSYLTELPRFTIFKIRHIRM